MSNKYQYEELKAKVVVTNAQEDINALGEWFEAYGCDYWNGEYYDADSFKLYPVYKEVEEDEFEVTGYELR